MDPMHVGAVPVPGAAEECDRLFAEGWTLEAPFDEPAYMRPPKAISEAMGLAVFVKEIEALGIQRAIARIEAMLRNDLPPGSVSAAHDLGLRSALRVLREEAHDGSIAE
jgi:hypothetical protein